MPLVRFNVKAYHNSQLYGPGDTAVVDESELGPHMDVLGEGQPEAPVTIVADEQEPQLDLTPAPAPEAAAEPAAAQPQEEQSQEPEPGAA